MRKNMGLKVVNMKRIWLRDNYSNFYDSFIAKHADNGPWTLQHNDDTEGCRGTLRFNESHAAQWLQWEVNKTVAAAVLGLSTATACNSRHNPYFFFLTPTALWISMVPSGHKLLLQFRWVQTVCAMLPDWAAEHLMKQSLQPELRLIHEHPAAGKY